MPRSDYGVEPDYRGWFGDTWDSVVNARVPHVPPPLGQLCPSPTCGRRIGLDDQGVIVQDPGEGGRQWAWHRECWEHHR